MVCVVLVDLVLRVVVARDVRVDLVVVSLVDRVRRVVVDGPGVDVFGPWVVVCPVVVGPGVASYHT